MQLVLFFLAFFGVHALPIVLNETGEASLLSNSEAEGAEVPAVLPFEDDNEAQEFLAEVEQPNLPPSVAMSSKIDFKCTISCGGYWLCVVRTGKGCKAPSGCICESFAF